MHQYRLEFSGDLTTVDVEARLARPALTLRARNGFRSILRAVESCEGDRLSRRANMRLPREVSCVRYRAKLPPSDSDSRLAGALPSGVLMTSPSTWLWLPQLAHEDTVQVEVAGDVRVSAPWLQQAPRRYVFGTSPQSSRSVVVLGAFDEISLDRLGASKLAAYVGPSEGRATVSAWLDAALRASAPDESGSGCLPNPDMHVVVIDVGGGRGPVPFGHVIRDQGETVRFFVNTSRPLDEFVYDWTAVHEFAHLKIPYVTGRQKWISEGIASYYQNVLQARSGQYSELEMWQRLTRSFSRGAESGHGTTPNGTAQEDFWRVRMMVYWSGAALALHADAELRHRTAGESNLDVALDALAACCLPSPDTWRGETLFERLDELVEQDVFVPLYRRFADTEGMPPTAELLARLGVVGVGDQARLDDDAPWAHIRRAITAPRACQVPAAAPAR